VSDFLLVSKNFFFHFFKEDLAVNSLQSYDQPALAPAPPPPPPPTPAVVKKKQVNETKSVQSFPWSGKWISRGFLSIDFFNFLLFWIKKKKFLRIPKRLFGLFRKEFRCKGQCYFKYISGWFNVVGFHIRGGDYHSKIDNK